MTRNHTPTVYHHGGRKTVERQRAPYERIGPRAPNGYWEGATCRGPRCEKTQLAARGLCSTHYRQDKLGQPLHPIMRRGLPLGEAILERCEEAEDGCWIWQMGLKNGYGLMRHPADLSTTSAHRLAYKAWVDSTLPMGDDVHHTCANKACVNPEHLERASRLDNILEMKERRGLHAEIAALKARIRELEAT